MSTSTALILKIKFNEDLSVDGGIIAELVGMLLPAETPDYVDKLTFVHNGREVMSRTMLPADDPRTTEEIVDG